MTFRISALQAEQFADFLPLTDIELEPHSVQRITVDAKPGFPCRVSLKEADIGETVLLLNFVHHNHSSPYRSSHAIYVCESARQAFPLANTIPDVLQSRLISVRGFNSKHNMVMADVAEGSELSDIIQGFFNNMSIAYLHLHNAKQGCYVARVDRT